MRLITLVILFCGIPFLCPILAQVSADFTANETSGCGSLQVSFSDNSSSTVGSIVSWDWDLGGVASTNENPGRVFGTPGTYTICLTVTDNMGNSATECKEDFIVVFHLPDPAFSTLNQTLCIGSEVEYIDESTSIDGQITDWIWGLGGTAGVVIENGSSAQVSSVYENPDSYTISLTVTDDNGCINTVTEEDFITVYDYPEIDVSISDTFNCSPPFSISLTNNNPDPNVFYTWDFGNGSSPFQGTFPPSVVYNDEGSFSITVIAQDLFTSCTDTLVLENIINIGNAVSFDYDLDQGCEDLTVDFTNNSMGGLSNYQWDFGDGLFSSEISPQHTYTQPGCYFVTLTGIVNGVCSDSYTSVECIEVFPLPSASFTNNSPIGCTIPHEVDFTGSTDFGLIFSWDFGNGESSDEQNPSVTFTEFGIYPIAFEVMNEQGCANTFYDTIRIVELQAGMNFDVIAGCTPVDFALADSSISITPINSWYWEVDTAFYDPNSPLFTSTEPFPNFSIADTGWYDVTLIVTNTLGCVDTVTNEGAIGVGLIPDVDFFANPLIACVDESIQFTDASSEYADWWIWDFGDSVFGEEENPVHSYDNPDTFDVALAVFHNGCDSVLAFEDYIIILDPRASFTIERNCENPYEISFINLATGADSTFWDFGYDAIVDTSSLSNPVAIYPDTGCYISTQIVYNFTTECLDSFERAICITDPLASFSLDPFSGCAPLNVNVSNSSVFDIAWQWTAPGGAISNDTIETPVITYDTPGVYSDIKLVVTDAFGCEDSIVFLEPIEVDGVDVAFESMPSGGCDPLDVQFIDNSSSFISPIESWFWNINNGTFETSDQNTSFFFDSTGIYPVSLTVTNEWGCISTLTVPNAVRVSRPVPLFSADSLSCPADTVEFTNMSMGDSLSYLWEFGDGGISDLENPGYQFVMPGTYSVCLTVTDFSGCEQSYCQSIDIITPIANFTADSTYANCPPLIVNFENLSQNALYYEWNFGDNSGISDLENPPHVYTSPGLFDVQLIASINENCTDTLFIEEYIELEGPVGEFFFDRDSLCIPESVTFIGSSADNFTYIWDFGDGQLDTTQNVSNDTVYYAFQEVGVFVPKLILIDSENCKRTLESPDSIYTGLLEIDFITTDSTLCEGEDETQFINLVNSSTEILNLNWFFEDGLPASSTDFEPMVSFPNNGLYDVTLAVENVFCIDTLTKEEFIGSGALPTAAFSASETSGCLPLGIQFFDESTISGGTISSWEWSFGGIGSVNEVNPFFEYTSPGSFDVNLIVTSEFNCSDTTTLEINVSEPIEPIISLSKPEICIGDDIQLSVAIQTDTAGLVYYWLEDSTLSCLECFESIANPLLTTTYYFVTSTSTGCIDTSEVTVNVLPYAIPDITITADTTICMDESIQLNVFSEGVVVYEWDQSDDGLSCSDCSDPIAEPLEETMYIVTVTNTFGCDAIDSVLVDVVDQNQSLLGDENTICQGDSILLDINIDGNVMWLNSNGLSCDDCNDPLAYPSVTTTYSVQLITADYGCEIIDTVTINVLALDDVNAGEDVQICIGESIQLNGLANSVDGTILWTPSTALSSDNVLDPLAEPQNTTTYVLMLEEDQCVLMDSVEIIVQFDTEVESFDFLICEGDTVELSFSGEADVVEWSPTSTLSEANIPNPLAFPTETTQYVLNASLSSCAEDTAMATVVVNKGPEVDGEFSYDKFPGVDVQIEIEAFGGSGNYSYDWLRYDGLTCNNCPDPLLTTDTSGFYTVVVTDEENDCATDKLVFINRLRTCNPELIGVPNVFSPNDDGYNDEVKPLSGTITEIYTFKIYSRWGALVFETDDINEGWDGTSKGEIMPTGVYAYYIEAPCPIDNSTVLKKGDITLVR